MSIVRGNRTVAFREQPPESAFLFPQITRIFAQMAQMVVRERLIVFTHSRFNQAVLVTFERANNRGAAKIRTMKVNDCLNISEIDFKDGIITYLERESWRVDELLEGYYWVDTLLQVEYPRCNNVFLLDVTFRSSNGKDYDFITYLILNYDWDNPVFEKWGKELATLKENMETAIELIDK